MRFFLRQCVYAFTLFCVAAFLLEALIPGFVAPFLDPLPYLMVACGLLCADAMFNHPSRTKRWPRISMAILLGIMLMLSSYTLWRGSHLDETAVMVAVAAVAVVLLTLLQHQES